MNFRNVVDLTNRMLGLLVPGAALSPTVTEETYEPTLRALLDTYDRMSSLPSKKKDEDEHFKDLPGDHVVMRLASSKRRGQSSGARLRSFVSALTDSGVPLQRAFEQAVRLNVGGRNSAR